MLNAPIGTSPMTSNIDLHPRKRKIRSNTSTINTAATAANIPTNQIFVPPLDQIMDTETPFNIDQLSSNQYSMYMMLQKKIDDKMGVVRPVKTKAPNGPKKWILQERTYALASNTSYDPTSIVYPPGLPEILRTIYERHHKERFREHLHHRVERERIIATYENEVLREYGRAVSRLVFFSSFCLCKFNIVFFFLCHRHA